MNCTDCKHRRLEATPKGVAVFCIHPDVRGGLWCGGCKAWRPMDGFGITDSKPVQLKCKRCGELQSFPTEFDARIGWVGNVEPEASCEAPDWCVGYEPANPEPAKKKKPSPQKTLF